MSPYIGESVSTYLLHINTSVLVSLKGRENKQCLCVVVVNKKTGETSQLKDVYLGCSKTESMLQICEYWENAGLTFSYEHF